MDLGSIFLILALLILVGLFISRPLFRRDLAVEVLDDQEDHQLSALLAERDRVLNALQELDFDHALGKIPVEDYPAQRAFLLQQGSEILRRLDTLDAGVPAEQMEVRIESALARRRASVAQEEEITQPRQPLPALVEDDEVEALLANRRRERREKSVGFCPKCGKPVQKSDRFCPKCGVTLT